MPGAREKGISTSTGVPAWLYLSEPGTQAEAQELAVRLVGESGLPQARDVPKAGSSAAKRAFQVPTSFPHPVSL